MGILNKQPDLHLSIDEIMEMYGFHVMHKGHPEWGWSRCRPKKYEVIVCHRVSDYYDVIIRKYIKTYLTEDYVDAHANTVTREWVIPYIKAYIKDL